LVPVVPALAPEAVLFFFVVLFFVAPVALLVDAAAPDETRLECFGRCLTFFVAASAGKATANAASSATSSTLIVLRIIPGSSNVRGTILHSDGFVMPFFADRNAAVRDEIYAAVVERGVAPTPHEVARATRFDLAEVERIYQGLADAHVIVLRPGTLQVAWAPPFSVLPTPFRTLIRGAAWFAPCAWDAFGIAAAMKKGASIEAQCASSGEALTCGVLRGRAYGDAVIHLLVPAAHFWDDIFFT